MVRAQYYPSTIPSPEEMLAEPSVRYWIKDALKVGLSKDCLDAARDAGLLAAVLGKRCDDIIGTDASRHSAIDHLEQLRAAITAGSLDLAMHHLDNAIDMLTR
jgi:hypothetical protein